MSCCRIRRAHRKAETNRRWYFRVLESTGFLFVFMLVSANKYNTLSWCATKCIFNLLTRMAVESVVPGHALHEKGLQRQKSVGPRNSSKEQRALLDPLINRLSNAGVALPSVYIGCRLFVLLERRSGDVFSMLWK